MQGENSFHSNKKKLGSSLVYRVLENFSLQKMVSLATETEIGRFAVNGSL